MSFDWPKITSLAYQTLIELDIKTFPITKNEIKCKDVIIISLQEYASLTECSISELTLNHEFDDAFLLSNLRPGLKMILFNEEKYEKRVKHTLWHEVGHIKCGHKSHGEKEEIEAHFFASQTNAPNILIRELTKRGYNINISFLINNFGLSKESAQKKLDYFDKFHFNHTNEYDDILIQQFNDYLNAKYPPKVNIYFDDYFDELEKDREKWEI